MSLRIHCSMCIARKSAAASSSASSKRSPDLAFCSRTAFLWIRLFPALVAIHSSAVLRPSSLSRSLISTRAAIGRVCKAWCSGETGESDPLEAGDGGTLSSVPDPSPPTCGGSAVSARRSCCARASPCRFLWRASDSRPQSSVEIGAGSGRAGGISLLVEAGLELSLAALLASTTLALESAEGGSTTLAELSGSPPGPCSWLAEEGDCGSSSGDSNRCLR
mmetsp:Transcript_25811/g.73106  ORF Transcript_25811/g.73106 Transcript_25811/m.73106 type:complete len:220 (-) Transcript_25811:853-1512(-)